MLPPPPTQSVAVVARASGLTVPSRRPPGYRLRNAAPLLDRLVVGAIPRFWHGGESPLLARRLEAEPAVRELRRHRGAGVPGVARAQSPVAPVAALGAVGSIFVDDSPLAEAALDGRGMDLPYIPDASLLIPESFVGHRIFLRRSAWGIEGCEMLATPVTSRGSSGTQSFS